MNSDPTPSNIQFSKLRRDLFASIVVFPVALPLCTGWRAMIDWEKLQTKTYHVRHRKKDPRNAKWYDRLWSQ